MKVEDLEHAMNYHGLRAARKIEDSDATIYLAETDREYDNPEFPNGYYQTAWFLANKASNGKLDVGRYLEFDGFHDIKLSDEDRREARLSATLEDARKFIRINIETGRLNG